MELKSQGKCNAPILLKPQSDVRLNKRRTSDSSVLTTSRGFKFTEDTAIQAMKAIEDIPKLKTAYSLVYTHKNGDEEVVELDFTGVITEKKKKTFLNG